MNDAHGIFASSSSRSSSSSNKRRMNRQTFSSTAATTLNEKATDVAGSSSSTTRLELNNGKTIGGSSSNSSSRIKSTSKTMSSSSSSHEKMEYENTQTSSPSSKPNNRPTATRSLSSRKESSDTTKDRSRSKVSNSSLTRNITSDKAVTTAVLTNNDLGLIDASSSSSVTLFIAAASRTSQAQLWHEHQALINVLVSMAISVNRCDGNGDDTSTNYASLDQSASASTTTITLNDRSIQAAILASCKRLAQECKTEAAVAATTTTVAKKEPSQKTQPLSKSRQVEPHKGCTNRPNQSTDIDAQIQMDRLFVAIHAACGLVVLTTTTTGSAPRTGSTSNNDNHYISTFDSLIRILYMSLSTLASSSAGGNVEHVTNLSTMAYCALGMALCHTMDASITKPSAQSTSSIEPNVCLTFAPTTALSETTAAMAFARPCWSSSSSSAAAVPLATKTPKRRLVLSSRSNTDSDKGADENGVDSNDVNSTQAAGDARNNFDATADAASKRRPKKQQPSKKSSSSSTSGNQLDAAQLLTMGIAATMSMIKILVWDCTTRAATKHGCSDETVATDQLCHLGRILQAWLVASAATIPTSGGNDKDVALTVLSASTIVSHCKAGQRLLWSAATAATNERSTISQSTTSRRPATKKDLESTKRPRIACPCNILRLQRAAIELYLLHDGTRKRDVDDAVIQRFIHDRLAVDLTVWNLLRKSHLESACAMAWKSAESFLLATTARQPTSHPSTVATVSTQHQHVQLREFHECIGPLLQVHAVAHDDIPGSFFEYCAYRALHACTCSDTSDDSSRHSTEHAIGLSSNRNYCSTCLFSDCSFPCPFHLEQGCNERSAIDSGASFSASATCLALVYHTLQMRRALESQALTGTRSGVDGKWDDDCASRLNGAHAAAITSRFQSLLSTMRRVEADRDITSAGAFTGLRLYKILSTIQLHKIVQRLVLQQSSSPSPMDRNGSTATHGCRSELATWAVVWNMAAVLLGDCVAPFYFYLHKHEEKLGPSTWAAGIASLRNAVALTELLPERSIVGDDEALSLGLKTSTWMKQLVQHVMANEAGAQLPQQGEHMDSTARFLYGVGKNRFDRERKSDAVLPFLLAMKLFVHLACTADSLSTLKLPSRFQVLATVFKELNLVNESVLTLVMALHFDVLEAGQTPRDHDTHQFGLTSYLAKYTMGVVSEGTATEAGTSLTSQRLGLETLLVQMMSRRDHSESMLKIADTSTPLSPLQMMDLLLAPRSENDTSLDVRKMPSLVTWNILDAMLASNQEDVAPSQQANRRVAMREKSTVLVDLMVKLGHDLQKHNCTTAALDDYKLSCRLADGCIQQIETDDSACIQVNRALLFVVASVSLISRRPFVSFDNWCSDGSRESAELDDKNCLVLAEHYATLACNTLDDLPSRSRHWGMLAKSFSAAFELYRLRLSSMEAHEKVTREFDLGRLKGLVDSLERAPMPSATAPLASMSMRCIFTLLSRLCALLALFGEDLCAAQVAKWNADATQGEGYDPHSWFKANVLDRLATDSLVSMDVLDSPKSAAIPQPSAAEELACRLRLLTRDKLDFKQLDAIHLRLQSLLDDLEVQRNDMSNDMTALLGWTRTTILLGLAECAERRGALELALRFRQQCFEECRKVTSVLNKRRNGKNSDGSSPSPFWTQVAYSTLPVRCTERQIECIQGVAALYSRLGDYRKARDYALLALKRDTTQSTDLTTKSTFARVVDFARAHPPVSCQEMQSRRLLLRLMAMSTPLDLVSIVFEDGQIYALPSIAASQAQATIDGGLEEIKDISELADLLNGYQSISTVRDEWGLHRLAAKKFVRYSISPEVARLVETFATSDEQASQQPLQLQYDAKLRDAALVLSDHERGGIRAESAAVEWLQDIVESSTCSNLCKAWSQFLLGSVALENARTTGHLRRLWETNFSDEINSPFLVEARERFNDAIDLLGSSRELLKRYALRSLALAYGPGTNDTADLTTFQLINASVGTVVEHRENNLFDCSSSPSPNDLEDKYTTSAIKLLDKLGMVLSSPWRFVTAALCPSGELLLASAAFVDSGTWRCKVSCVLPGPDNATSSDMFDEMLQPLNAIVSSSHEQLSEDLHKIGNDGSKGEQQARQWWNSRKRSDQNLQELLLHVENVLLSANAADEVLLGLGDSDDLDDSRIESLRGENLAAKFDAVGESDDRIKGQAVECAEPESMKVADLRSELERRGHSAKALRKMKKSELLNLMRQSSVPFTKSGARIRESDEACTFLILDENLQRFPFEGLPMFDGKTLSRIPSLSFAFSALTQARANGQSTRASFRSDKVSYILDPESNLLATRDRLSPFLESLQQASGHDWPGIVGDAPAPEFMEQALSAENGLLLYFGHGGGQQYYSRSKIEALGQARRDQNSPLASIVLMGCSSGKLESVNTKHSKATTRLPIHYEPEGLALTYLLAGAPCVVGNLWDVTDRDIDRYSTALLESVFDARNDDVICGATKSIAQCVAASRTACKMRYIVGCAPVCYGFPVALQWYKYDAR